MAAVIGGGGLAILFAQSRWIEASLFPYAVVLQVTPIIAIAPLILIYVRNGELALLICAWLVAFFPILSNTTLGLTSVDPNMLDLMRALPGQAGAGAVVSAPARRNAVFPRRAADRGRAEPDRRRRGPSSTAGTATAGTGLAYRILESGYRLDIPRMYAALVLLTLSGVAIYAVLSLISWLILHRWHESALRRE